tara:strand:+ start:571 stop:735 length:165 start_codon:yes stop_codon:yes gene_type:complete
MADYIMIVENGKRSCVEIRYTVLNPIKKFSKFIRMEDKKRKIKNENNNTNRSMD